MPYGTPSTPVGQEWRAEFGVNTPGNNATVVVTINPDALASDTQKDAVFQAAVDALTVALPRVVSAVKASVSYQQVTPTE